MQTNVYPDSPDYVYITIFDHHQEYQLPKHPRVRQRTMWDGFDAQSIIDVFIKLCCPTYPKSTDYQHVSDEHLWAVLKQRCFTEPNALPGPIIEFDPNVDVYATIYRIGGRIPNLIEWAKLYAIEIKRECHNVGGDDGYYDYFPTYLEMFYCICRELSLRDLYDSTLRYVMRDPSSQYHDDDEGTIDNHWTE